MSDRHGTPAVAVVAVTHESDAVIGAWLDALEATGLRSRLELCVVDSGSSPAGQDALKAAVTDRVDALELTANLGYGRAGNVGARLTTAPVLLFTNPDTQVRSLPAAALRNELEGRIVGGVKRLPDGGDRPLGFAHVPTLGGEVASLALGRRRRRSERTATAPVWVSGAALMISRADFEALGGFARDLFMYYEDVDLCARHRSRGGQVTVDAGLLVEHGSAASSVVADADRLRSGLDSVGKLSARTFLARTNGVWQAAVLYVVLASVYVPRRVGVSLARGLSGRRTLDIALDLLFPARVLRRMAVPRLERSPG